MNPFKPRHTFESVVRELIAGLEDGTIVLSEEKKTPQPEKQRIEFFLFSAPLGMRMKASSALAPTNRRHRFVEEWVRVDLDTIKDLPIDFGPWISAPIKR